MIKQLDINISGQGLHAFTPAVRDVVTASGMNEGLCTCESD